MVVNRRSSPKRTSVTKAKDLGPSPEKAIYQMVGTLRRGMDGHVWQVRSARGIKRWVRLSVKKGPWAPLTNCMSLTDSARWALNNKLSDKLEDWWGKMAEGAQLVLYNDGSTEFVETTADNFGLNDVKMILWSSLSGDTLTFFVIYLTRILPPNTVRGLVRKSKESLVDWVLSNVYMCFVPYPNSDGDIGKLEYTFQGDMTD